MKRVSLVLPSVLLAFSFWLLSCRSANREDYSILASARDAETYTEPLKLQIEAEGLYLRADLIRNQKTIALATSGETAVVNMEYSPLGVYLGNNLAMDSKGNVYLDLFRLFKIDFSQDFILKQGRQEVYHKGDVFYATTLSEENVYNKNAIEISDKGLYVKSAFGVLRAVKLAEDGSKASYRAAMVKEDVTAGKNELILKNLIGAVKSFTLDAQGSVSYGAGSKTIYVSKNGDAYDVKIGESLLFIPKGNQYSIYFLYNRIVVKKGETVLTDWDIAPDQVSDHLTHKVLVSYQKL
jgi:hypothetical protein